MPRQSYPSSKTRFLNKEEVINSLKKLAFKVYQQEEVEGVYLFGSLVNETYTPRSDADILVLLKRHKLKPRDRIPIYLEFFLEAPVPVDIFPFTKEEIKANPFLVRALKQSLNLLEKSS